MKGRFKKEKRWNAAKFFPSERNRRRKGSLGFPGRGGRHYVSVGKGDERRRFQQDRLLTGIPVLAMRGGRAE